jgi:hypothetical protein
MSGHHDEGVHSGPVRESTQVREGVQAGLLLAGNPG